MALNLSLRTKLAVTIVTIGVIVSGVNLYQTAEVERASEATRKLVNEDMERLDRLQQARVENARLLPVLNIDTSASEALINPTIQTELNNYARNLQGETASYIAQSKEDPDHTFDEKLFVDLTTAVEGVVTASAALSTNTASAFNELNDKTAQVDAIIGTLEKGEREGVADRKAAIESATGQVKLMFIFMTLGVTGASVLIGIILMTSISRSHYILALNPYLLGDLCLDENTMSLDIQPNTLHNVIEALAKGVRGIVRAWWGRVAIWMFYFKHGAVV